MEQKIVVLLFATAFFFACNSPVSKKVLVVGKGKITVAENNISMDNGSGYAEETIELRGDKPVTWNVSTPSGKTTVNIPVEVGLYLLNLRTDTIVGSQQILGRDLGGRTISQEELKVKIDSLTKITSGENVAQGTSNFLITPNQLVKVTPNLEGRIFGPFTKIPASLDPDKDGKTPEIFKFYTNTEMRQLIANLKKLTY